VLAAGRATENRMERTTPVPIRVTAACLAALLALGIVSWAIARGAPQGRRPNEGRTPDAARPTEWSTGLAGHALSALERADRAALLAALDRMDADRHARPNAAMTCRAAVDRMSRPSAPEDLAVRKMRSALPLGELDLAALDEYVRRNAETLDVLRAAVLPEATWDLPLDPSRMEAFHLEALDGVLRLLETDAFTGTRERALVDTAVAAHLAGSLARAMDPLERHTRDAAVEAAFRILERAYDRFQDPALLERAMDLLRPEDRGELASTLQDLLAGTLRRQIATGALSTDEQMKAWVRDPGSPLAALARQLREADALSRMRRAVDWTIAAVKLHRARTGDYPASLDRLAAAGFPAPVDPVTGRRFVYRRTADGFELCRDLPRAKDQSLAQAVLVSR
jgi:hypothetical protein